MTVKTHSVPNVLSFMGRRRLLWVTLQPRFLDELIKLFGPEHARKCLSHDLPEVVADWTHDETVVEFIRFLSSLLNGVVEDAFILNTWVLRRLIGRKLHPHHSTTTATRDIPKDIMRSRLRTLLLRVDKIWSEREGRTWPLLLF
jgi:hypothetical protein